jgi:NADPH:quinone reductase-like Zn-dependent oxidoreductase
MGNSQAAPEIPKTMRRWVLVKVNSDLAKAELLLESVPTPTPKSGEVLIKVVSSPVNPSDYGIWCRDRPVSDPEPIGNEGSGIVVSSGGGVYANSCVGCNVGFTANVKGSNSYAEYIVVNALKGAYKLPATVPLKDAASHFVNPYTAYGFIDTVRSRHVAHPQKSPIPGFVQTAAASQLGQMLVKLCLKEKITLINLVRREEQAEALRLIGAKYVIVTKGDTWKDKLKALIKEHGIQFAFDAVAGEMTGQLLSLLPFKGTCFVYGRLSNQGCSDIQPLDLIYMRKKLEGWFLTSWATSGGLFATQRRISGATSVVHEGLIPVAGKEGSPGAGWARTQFEECSIEDMHTRFLDFHANGFTGRKLCIVMSSEDATATEEQKE